MLVKFNPQAISDMRRTMNSIARDFVAQNHNFEAPAFIPQTDIIQEDGVYKIFMDMPGISKEDVKVNIENKELIIKGERKFNYDNEKSQLVRRERKFGNFERTFTLSEDVNIDDIKAHFENGVLYLTVPLREEVKPREIEIAIS